MKPSRILLLALVSAVGLVPTGAAGHSSALLPGRLEALDRSAEAPKASSYNVPAKQSNAPSNTLFIPALFNQNDGWTSTVTVFNPNERPVGVNAVLYDEAGQSVGLRSSLGTLPAHGSASFGSDPRDSTGTRRSVVLSADQPIVAVADHVHPSRNRMSNPAISAPADRLDAPLLFRNSNGWNSTMLIMNMDSRSALVTVQYRSAGAQTTEWDEQVSIPPRATVALEQGADALLPEGSALFARVTSVFARVGVYVLLRHRDGAAASYNAEPIGQTMMYAPVLFKNRTTVGTWATGMQLTNFAGLPAPMSILYRGVPPTEYGGWLDTTLVGTGQAVTLYTPSQEQLPDNGVFSALVVGDAGQPAVGLVNQTNYSLGVGMAYNMLTSGGNVAYAPLVYSNFEGWSSGIQVQNIAASDLDATVTFYEAATGREIAHATRPIRVTAAETFYLPALGLPDRFVGAARITSAGQPLSAIVNHVKY